MTRSSVVRRGTSIRVVTAASVRCDEDGVTRPRCGLLTVWPWVRRARRGRVCRVEARLPEHGVMEGAATTLMRWNAHLQRGGRVAP
jgi:hypothetical protein